MSQIVNNLKKADIKKVHHDLPLLFVDDEKDIIELFNLHFEEHFTIVTAENAEQGIKILENNEIGLVITDERMPGMSGIDFLNTVSKRWPDTIRMIISAYSDAQRLFKAINSGHAHEYLTKPWSPGDVYKCIDNALFSVYRRRQLMQRAIVADLLESDIKQQYNPGTIIGSESGLKDIITKAKKAAVSDAAILITGETGTGKELIARFIHENSTRVDKPFIKVNCAALTDSLLQSELFGHEKGAFTGAVKTKKGRFELAEEGTILLDEIGDISPSIQVALLRVLQEKEFERVGGVNNILINVRILAATNCNLEERVKKGNFREDLFFRLNVIPVHVPPLRKRSNDIRLFIEYFVLKYSQSKNQIPEISDKLIKILTYYQWPGNVRELENLVQRAMVLSSTSKLTIEDFSLDFKAADTKSIRIEHHQAEIEKIKQVLIEQGGNYTRAAKTLGIPRTTLIGRAKKYGIY